ncbi:MAG: right-handed parallel beta-helix repeat-containing protein [Candidatus Binataceae bacterium]
MAPVVPIGIESETAGTLYVEDCTINGFVDQGIAFTPSGGGRLFIERTIVRNNAGYGILIKPSGGSAVASIDATHVENNLAGIRAEDNSVVTTSNSVAASNTNSGFVAVSTSSPVSITIDHSIASGNRVGVNVSGAGALARITAVTATANVTGLGTTGGTGQIVSFGNNRVSGNATDGGPTSTVPQI